jgi:hypothetical protein
VTHLELEAANKLRVQYQSKKAGESLRDATVEKGAID